jgi:hypothetical protein
VVHPTEKTFMLGRHIIKGVVVLHKTIHKLHWKKIVGVLFKIDVVKAYDKINWCFF